MIHVRVRNPERPGETAVWRAFRLAGHDVVSDVELVRVPGFAVADGAVPPPAVELRPDVNDGEQVFHGPAFVCGSTREVACALTPRGYDLRVAGVGRFAVALDGSFVACVTSERTPEDADVAEAVLGPALTLALALQGTFCLHASAVASECGALLFLGASAAGKSTLASGLSRSGRAFGLLTDDITPIVPSPAGVEVWPHFPQPKLPAERQPAGVTPESIRLGAAYLLDLPGHSARGDVSIEPLDPARVLATIVRHTVAVRLFGRELLATYIGALAAARTIPVRRLRYPRRYEVIPDVAAALEADAGWTAGS